MKFTRVALLCVGACLPVGLLRAQMPVQEIHRWVPGELLLAPLPGKEAEVATLLAAAGVEVLEEDTISRLLRVGVSAGHEGSWMQVLSSVAEIDIVERNGIGSGVSVVPNDTHYGQAWHLNNTGQQGGTSGADIDAEAAWELSIGSPSVVIAVLDSGIDSDHPEFAGRIDPDGYDFVDEDDDPEADHPHGTWVAGCLAANAGNGFATAGVDWRCKILPIKVLDDSNAGSTFDLVQGIYYAASQDDVRVISMSLGGYPNALLLRNALRDARRAGKILIAAAGNEGIAGANSSYPGAFPITMSIGATTDRDTRASFSGTGGKLDFVAPGAAVVVTRHGSSVDDFSVVSGTSFATPITSGVVGLVLALADRRGFALDQRDVYEILCAGAEDQVGDPSEDWPGRDNFYGHGRINAYRSLMAVPLVLDVDVRPGSVANPVGPSSDGLLPVLLLGSAEVDATTVKPGSVTLSRRDRVGEPIAPSAGPSGPGAIVTDLGSVVGIGSGAARREAGDGIPDLLFHFSMDELTEAFELADIANGTTIEVVLRGTLTTVESFVAVDRVTVGLSVDPSGSGH